MRPQGGTQAGFPQVHGLSRVPKAPEGNLNWPSPFISSWMYTDEGSERRERKRWAGTGERMRDPSVEEEDRVAEHGTHIPMMI